VADIAHEVFSSDVSSKTLRKTFCKQNFPKKSIKKSKTAFSSVFVCHVLGVSLQGELKNMKINLESNLTCPGTFLASEEPTNKGGREFLFIFIFIFIDLF
jgi:hypothetical protein